MPDIDSSEQYLKVSAENFGPIAKAEIELRPLTVFVGPSNTGKSYFAALIYALHEAYGGYSSFRFRPRLSRHLFSRRPIGFSFAREQLSSHADRRLVFEQLHSLAQRFQFTDDPQLPLNEPRGDLVSTSLGNLIDRAFEDVDDLSAAILAEICRCFGLDDPAPLIRNKSRQLSIGIRRHTTSPGNGAPKFEHGLSATRSGSKTTAAFFGMANHFLSAPHSSDRNIQLWARRVNSFADFGEEKESYLVAQFLTDLVEYVLAQSVDPLGRTAHYLPADRTGIMHSHRVVVSSMLARVSRAGLDPDIPLPHVSGVVSDFLSQLLELGESQHSRTRPFAKLARQFETQMLRGSIIADYSDLPYPEISYRPSGWSRDLRLMHSSSMVSELAPVVLYLREFVSPGDVLMIEEPESHLHPGMQVEFARLLAATVNAGVRVVITTHSEWVLDEIAKIVQAHKLPKSKRKGIDGAEHALDAKRVGAWLFEPKNRPKGSVVSEIALDEDSGSFPAGYTPVLNELYNNWVEVETRLQESTSQ